MEGKNINRGFKNFLNIALGSCGEFHSCYDSCRQAGQINKAEFEEIEKVHYKVENELLRLIASLQKKAKEGDWADNLSLRELE
ncbi:MAG: four helix bundle protein [Deltaproteobacteria bacterium]